MGKALLLQSGRVTNPGATITALTVNASESFTVPAFAPGSAGSLFAPWSPGVTAGVARIRSPRMHDAAQGIRLQRAANGFEPLAPLGALTPIYSSDALTVEASGGGAETDQLAFLEYFDDLPGIDARLASWPEVSGRVANIMAVEVDLTSGAVGAYGTAVALNANFDTFKAGEDYAILGYVCSVRCGIICLFGPDTGNQHIGGPGLITPNTSTREWFVRLSDETGKPCIPIINSNNKGSTFLQAADVSAALAVNVSLVMAELR